MLDMAKNKLFSSFFRNFQKSSYKLISSKEGKEEVYYKGNGNLVVFVGEEFQETIYDVITSLKSSGKIETEGLGFQITKYYANSKKQILAFKAHIEKKDRSSTISWEIRPTLERLIELVSFAEAMQEAGYYLQEEKFDNESCTQICAFLSFFTCEGTSENLSKGCLIKYVHYLLSYHNDTNLEEYYKNVAEGKLYWRRNDFPYSMPIANMCYGYYKEGKQPKQVWKVLGQGENRSKYYTTVDSQRLSKELPIVEENDLYTVYQADETYWKYLKIYHDMPVGFEEFLTDTDMIFEDYEDEVIEHVRIRLLDFDGKLIGYGFSKLEAVKFSLENAKDSYEIVKTCSDVQAYLLQMQRKLQNVTEYWTIGQKFSIQDDLVYNGMFGRTYLIKDIWSLCALRETSAQEIKKQMIQLFFKWYIIYLQKEYGNLEKKTDFLEKPEVRYMNPILANELIHFAQNDSVNYQVAEQAFHKFADNLKRYGDETQFCVDESYIYDSAIKPFLFDYEFSKKYGMNMKKGTSVKLPNGQLVVIFKRKKSLSSVKSQEKQVYDNFIDKIGEPDDQLKFVEVSEYIYSSNINAEEMYSVVGYVTKPITGKKLTTEVLLSLNNRELYEVIDILFSKFRKYWIPQNSDIWLDGGHPVDGKANKIYINVLSESFQIAKWKRPESFMKILLNDLMEKGYNPYAFYIAKLYSSDCDRIDWGWMAKVVKKYCKQHDVYYEAFGCPICLKNRKINWDALYHSSSQTYEDEIATYHSESAYNIKVYKNPEFVSDAIKENIQNMIDAKIKIEVMVWLSTTGKAYEDEKRNLFGQEGFIPEKLVVNEKQEVIGYTYYETAKQEKAIDLQDTENLSNRPRLMALIRLMTQVKSLVEQGKGFIQNPFGHVFLAKEYKKQVQILNVEYLSTQGNAKDTLKWTYEYVCKTIALDETIHAEELYNSETKYSAEQFNRLLENMQNLAKKLTKYCTIHHIYYGDRTFCPKCIDEKELTKDYMEEVSLDKITSQEPVGEGGESIIYPYQKDKVAKVFREDMVDKNFKAIVLGRVLKKKGILQKVNHEKKKYHYVVPQKLLVDSESREFFGYVMEKVEGMPLSNLKDKEEIERLGFTMQDVFEILITVGEGIENLHKNDIYIGDLNGRNILFDAKKNVYFLEFDGMGIDGIAPVFCTDGYIDPVSKKNHNITMKDDWYSFAIQAFYYLTFTHPFNGIYAIEKEGQEVMLSIPEKMEHKVSLLGNHGMEVPKIARSWEWMSQSLKSAFLSIFEKDSRESILPKLVQEYNRMYQKSVETDVVEVVRNMKKLRAKETNGNVIRINPKFVATKIDPFSAVAVERVINENAAVICKNKENATIELLVLGHKMVIPKAGINSVVKNVILLSDHDMAVVIYEEKSNPTYSIIIAYDLNTGKIVFEEAFISEIRYEVVNGNTLYFLTDNEMIEKRTFTPDGYVNREQIEFLKNQKTMGFFVRKNSKFVIIKEGEEGRDEVYCNNQKLCEIDGRLPNRKYNIIYDTASRTWLIINSEGYAILIEENGEYYSLKFPETEVENIKYQKRTVYVPQREYMLISKIKKDQILILSKKLECHKIMTPQTRLYNINQEGFSMITDNTLYEVRRG